MRLYDLVLPALTGPGSSDIAMSAVSAVRIDTTNVYAYWLGSDIKEKIGSQYPNIAPPFNSMWFEFRKDRSQVGTLVVASSPSSIYGSVFYFDGLSGRWVEIGAWEGVFDPHTGQPIGAVDYTLFADESEIRSSFSKGVIDHSIGSTLLAISFMHCKNVVLEDAPFIGPRQQRRALERKGIQQARFKTLVIDPMKQVLKTEGGIEHNGLKKALHICRGHFATYSEDKPLFGRYSGTFWKPAHVRGNADNGTVYKDYKVKAPKE